MENVERTLREQSLRLQAKTDLRDTSLQAHNRKPIQTTMRAIQERRRRRRWHAICNSLAQYDWRMTAAA
jgi:hypothetical protein